MKYSHYQTKYIGK